MDNVDNSDKLEEETKYVSLGNTHLDKRQYDSAKGAYTKALAINPRNAYAYGGLGHVYLQQKQNDLAQEAFNKAIQIKTEVECAHQGLGTIYLEQDLYSLAETEFKKTLEFNNENIFVHQMLGYVYKRLGKHELAVDEFIKATNLYLSRQQNHPTLQDVKEEMRDASAHNSNQEAIVKIFRMPTFSHTEKANSVELNFSLLPPLALGQITAYLKAHGITIYQDDLNIKIHYDNQFTKASDKDINTSVFFDEERVSRYLSGAQDTELDSIMEKVESKTKFYSNNIILLSLPIIFSNSSGLMFTLSLARFLKKKYNPFVIVGGGNQSIELLSKYNCKDIDFIIYGDGEVILFQLLSVLKNKIELKEFLDLQIKENGRIISTGIHPPLKPDFTDLPMDKYRYRGFDARHNTEVSEILNEFNNYGTLLLPFKFIRGCPYECIFCPESTNKSVYILEPEMVARYLKELQEEYNPTGFFFLSDTINISKQYVNELCYEIIKKRIKILWTDSARADNLDKDTLLKMREAGCIRLVFGMETASARLLKYVDKRISLTGLEHTLRWSTEAGIWTGLEIICGLPHENDADIEETIVFLNRNKEYIHTIYFNQFGLRDDSILLQKQKEFAIQNIIELNQYANDEFTYFHKYGYDEIGGLQWEDKKRQILASHKKLITNINWHSEFPIYEFEHFLFFLYNKFNDMQKIYDIFIKVAAEKRLLASGPPSSERVHY